MCKYVLVENKKKSEPQTLSLFRLHFYSQFRALSSGTDKEGFGDN